MAYSPPLPTETDAAKTLNSPAYSNITSSPPPSSRSLLAKLLQAKTQIQGLQKDSRNTYTDSLYVSLNQVIEAVEAALSPQGVICLTTISTTSPPSVITRLVDVETGEELSSSFPLTDPAPQKVAAAVTYARRVSLVAMLNLRAMDDDGNSAAGFAGPPGQQVTTTASVGGPFPDEFPF